MGQSIDEIVAQVHDGDTVNVVMVSNQDDGIATYTVGGLVFRKATGGLILGGPRFIPARLESSPGQPLQMFFGDRMLNIDPPPPAGGFGGAPRQPFNANATEKVGMSISLGGTHVMQLQVFGSKSLVTLSTMGDLLVGLGPSMGPSGAAGVFVVAFLGIIHPPH